MATTKDFMATAKKQNSTILKARLKSGKFECPEEKEAYLSVLKLRGIDVSVYEIPKPESEEVLTDTVPEVEKETKEELSGSELNDAADEAYELCANENDQKKISLLAAVYDDGAGRARDWEELTDDDKREIIKISKMKPEVKSKTLEKKESTPKVKVEIGPFTEEQKVIAETEGITKAERVRQLYLLGCSVKQIARNTGWDYVNAYDTIKAYEKKQAKLAAEKSNELG
jgi:hypothetical protein